MEDPDSANLRLPISTCLLYLSAPWLVVSLFLSECVKTFTLPHVFRGRFFLSILSDKHIDVFQIYTDGSRDRDRVPAALVAHDNISRSRLPDGISVCFLCGAFGL